MSRHADTTSPAGEGARALRASEPSARAAVYRHGETAYLGRTRAAGATLRHYRTTTRADRALAVFVPTLSPKVLRRQAGARPVTYDTWLDARNRPTRIVVTIPGAGDDGGAITTRTTFER